LRGSRFKGSGRWLTGNGGIFCGKYGFRSNAEYKAEFRTRLLLSPALSSVGVASDKALCSCRSEIFMDKAPFHSLDCSSSQWYYKHRHDGVRDILIQFLKEYSSDDPNLYKFSLNQK
jgi:hypothetical protein